MEMHELFNAISSVGFPIVACGALFWMINNSMKELTVANTELTEAIKDLTTYLKYGGDKQNETHD